MRRHKPMDFEELDQMFRYDAETGDIFHKIDKGRKDGAGGQVKAGAIATHKTGKGYLEVFFRKNGRRARYRAHRVAWLLGTGEDPGEKEIDHLNRIKDDNRFCNLELVTRAEHRMRHPKLSTNTSGVTGVYWNQGTGKWQVRISDRGKEKYLGIFSDKFEAVCARKSAERRLGYHENHGK